MAWVQEIYDDLYDQNTICVACISHGKDSLAMLRAIKHLGLPLHRIVTTDVWATQDIPAVLPEMWEILLKWDKDSPVSFKPDGHKVHDFDERFALEDQGLITPSDPWKWAYLKDMPIQMKMNF
jgi:hypothetical protein